MDIVLEIISYTAGFTSGHLLLVLFSQEPPRQAQLHNIQSLF